MTVEVLGAQALAASLAAASARLERLDSAEADAARQLTQAGRAEAPKVTGRLAGSIHATRAPHEIRVGSGLVYAPVIHNGWARRNISPNPYLRRGLEDTAPYIVDVYARSVSDAVSRVRGA